MTQEGDSAPCNYSLSGYAKEKEVLHFLTEMCAVQQSITSLRSCHELPERLCLPEKEVFTLHFRSRLEQALESTF